MSVQPQLVLIVKMCWSCFLKITNQSQICYLETQLPRPTPIPTPKAPGPTWKTSSVATLSGVSCPSWGMWWEGLLPPRESHWLPPCGLGRGAGGGWACVSASLRTSLVLTVCIQMNYANYLYCHSDLSSASGFLFLTLLLSRSLGISDILLLFHLWTG